MIYLGLDLGTSKYFLAEQKGDKIKPVSGFTQYGQVHWLKEYLGTAYGKFSKLVDIFNKLKSEVRRTKEHVRFCKEPITLGISVPVDASFFYMQDIKKAIQEVKLRDVIDEIVFVPESLASLYGYTEYEKLIDCKEPILLIDMGAWTTDYALAMVEEEKLKLLDLEGGKNIGGNLFSFLLYQYFNNSLGDDKFDLQLVNEKKIHKKMASKSKKIFEKYYGKKLFLERKNLESIDADFSMDLTLFDTPVKFSMFDYLYEIDPHILQISIKIKRLLEKNIVALSSKTNTILLEVYQLLEKFKLLLSNSVPWLCKEDFIDIEAFQEKIKEEPFAKFLKINFDNFTMKTPDDFIKVLNSLLTSPYLYDRFAKLFPQKADKVSSIGRGYFVELDFIFLNRRIFSEVFDEDILVSLNGFLDRDKRVDAREVKSLHNKMGLLAKSMDKITEYMQNNPSENLETVQNAMDEVKMLANLLNENEVNRDGKNRIKTRLKEAYLIMKMTLIEKLNLSIVLSGGMAQTPIVPLLVSKPLNESFRKIIKEKMPQQNLERNQVIDETYAFHFPPDRIHFQEDPREAVGYGVISYLKKGATHDYYRFEKLEFSYGIVVDGINIISKYTEFYSYDEDITCFETKEARKKLISLSLQEEEPEQKPTITHIRFYEIHKNDVRKMHSSKVCPEKEVSKLDTSRVLGEVHLAKDPIYYDGRSKLEIHCKLREDMCKFYIKSRRERFPPRKGFYGIPLCGHRKKRAYLRTSRIAVSRYRKKGTL